MSVTDSPLRASPVKNLLLRCAFYYGWAELLVLFLGMQNRAQPIFSSLGRVTMQEFSVLCTPLLHSTRSRDFHSPCYFMGNHMICAHNHHRSHAQLSHLVCAHDHHRLYAQLSHMTRDARCITPFLDHASCLWLVICFTCCDYISHLIFRPRPRAWFLH